MTICKALGYPNHGWQKAATDKANKLGHSVSQPTISQTLNDPSKSISPRLAQTMRALADAVASGDFAPGFARSGSAPATPREANEFVYQDPDDLLSDDEIITEIAGRFETFEECVEQVVLGNRPSTLISGPAGCGKSHCIGKYAEKAIEDGIYYELIKGDISPINLYMALHRASEGGVLCFDDCDSVFKDETTLNLLKAALEVLPPGRARKICWLKESGTLQKEDIPNSIDFQGRILFLTNIDFQRECESGSKKAEHVKALLSRSGYMNLGLFSKRRRLLRVVQVCQDSGIMVENGVTDPKIQQEILDFVHENVNKWRQLSLRLIVHLCNYRMQLPGERWKHHARMLQMVEKR